MTNFFYSKKKKKLTEAETIALNYSTDLPSLSIGREDLPIFVNLPAFESFSGVPSQSSLSRIFGNTLLLCVLWLLIQKISLKEVLYLT